VLEFDSPLLASSITWLVLVSPSRSAYPKVVCAHSNYVYKTCSMHQYNLVPLPPNFHHSSYFEPTNSKSEHQYYLPLCTVGASSTGYGPWCQWQWCLKQHLNGSSKRLVLVVISMLSAHHSQQCSYLVHSAQSDTASCTYHSAMLLTSAPRYLVMRLKDCSETTVLSPPLL